MSKITNPFAEIEQEVTALMKLKLELSNEIEVLNQEREKLLDSIFTDLLLVVDSFDKADKKTEEQYPEDESVLKTRKRFITAKKKLLTIFEKYGVSEIAFPDGLAIPEDTQIVDTEPDLDKPSNHIVSVEKKGYRRNGRLLRLAEVVVVKN